MQKAERNKILKVVAAILILAAISIGIFLILRACGVISYTENGNIDVEKFRNWIAKYEQWAGLVFIVVRVLCTVFLCFVPSISMAFDLLSLALFPTPVEAFICSFISVVCVSLVMDLIGRFGGSQLIIRLIGEEDYNNAVLLVREKGMVYVPVMYLLPIFPDDAVCMVCGATKIKLWLHAIYIILCRGIGCATAIFGVTILPSNVTSFTSKNPWDYIVVLTIIIFWVYVLFVLANKFDKWLSKKMKVGKYAESHVVEEAAKESETLEENEEKEKQNSKNEKV